MMTFGAACGSEDAFPVAFASSSARTSPPVDVGRDRGDVGGRGRRQRLEDERTGRVADVETVEGERELVAVEVRG
jgi:hypothetical protein